MVTAPIGNSRSPSLPAFMVVPSGSAKARSFSAPSDQNGTLTANGITPAASFVGLAGWLRTGHRTSMMFFSLAGSSVSPPSSDVKRERRTPSVGVRPSCA